MLNFIAETWKKKTQKITKIRTCKNLVHKVIVYRTNVTVTVLFGMFFQEFQCGLIMVSALSSM